MMRSLSSTLVVVTILYAAGPALADPDCFRPSPPLASSFEDRQQYSVAVEDYYRQAGVYLDCLNIWVDAARTRYEQMFYEEAQTYIRERSDVLQELRSVSQTALASP